MSWTRSSTAPPRQHHLHRPQRARAFIDIADTVTDVGVTKHAYQAGIRAKKGIDF